MFRHNYISNDYKAVTLASLFEYREEATAAASGVEEWQAPIAGTSDKVQIMSAVSAVQTDGHDKSMVSAASYPPLQKTQERGTHSFESGKKNHGKAGPPARISLMLLVIPTCDEIIDGEYVLDSVLENLAFQGTCTQLLNSSGGGSCFEVGQLAHPFLLTLSRLRLPRSARCSQAGISAVETNDHRSQTKPLGKTGDKRDTPIFQPNFSTPTM